MFFFPLDVKIKKLKIIKKNILLHKLIKSKISTWGIFTVLMTLFTVILKNGNHLVFVFAVKLYFLNFF